MAATTAPWSSQSHTLLSVFQDRDRVYEGGSAFAGKQEGRKGARAAGLTFVWRFYEFLVGWLLDWLSEMDSSVPLAEMEWMLRWYDISI